MLNGSSKVNAMSLVYIKKLDFKTWKTNIRVQKINSSNLKIFEMVITDF